VAVVPLLLRTSERFLWVLAAAEVSFGRALRAPWPSNASWQRSQSNGNTSNSSSSSGGVGAEKSASAAASSNIPWTLVVRQLNVSALKLNLNYTKGVGTPKGPAAASSSSKPRPSDDRFGGSMLDQASSIVSSASFASVASDGEGSFGNSSRHTSINAAALTSSAAGGGGGSGTAQHNRRRHNQSPQYPESTLGFALRALRVSLSNATVELREFALVAWRGTPNALVARMAHHYVMQLKQWTFTLLTAASPSFGFGYFRSRNSRALQLLTEADASKRGTEHQIQK